MPAIHSVFQDGLYPLTVNTLIFSLAMILSQNLPDIFSVHLMAFQIYARFFLAGGYRKDRDA
jgi:hypothetical protein